MSDPSWIATLLALALSVPLIVFAVFDVQVARELRNADAVKPSIPFLGLVKGVIYGVSVGGVIFAIIGIASVLFNVVQVRILPPPVALILIYTGCVSASFTVWRLRRWIRVQT